MAQINPRQTGVTCTPEGLIAENPCLNCLSVTDLKKALVFILDIIQAYYNSSTAYFPNNFDGLLEDSACFNCMSDRQLLQSLVSILANLAEAVSQETPDLTELGCLNCSDDTHKINAMIVYLLCRWINGVENPA